MEKCRSCHKVPPVRRTHPYCEVCGGWRTIAVRGYVRHRLDLVAVAKGLSIADTVAQALGLPIAGRGR